MSPVKTVQPEMGLQQETDVQYGRLVWHMASISGGAFVGSLIESWWWLQVSLIILVPILLIISESRPAWLMMVVSRISRAEEEAGWRFTSTDFGLGLAIGWIFYDYSVLLAAMHVTAYCDPMARLCGIKLSGYWPCWLGHAKWPRSKKSKAGSLACLLTAAAVILICGFTWWQAVMIGVVAAVAEFPSQQLVKVGAKMFLTPADNMLLLLATGATLQLTTM